MYCTVLYCILLYCTLPTILCCTHYSVLPCTILHCTIQFVLHCTIYTIHHFYLQYCTAALIHINLSLAMVRKYCQIVSSRVPGPSLSLSTHLRSCVELNLWSSIKSKLLATILCRSLPKPGCRLEFTFTSHILCFPLPTGGAINPRYLLRLFICFWRLRAGVYR